MLTSANRPDSKDCVTIPVTERRISDTPLARSARSPVAYFRKKLVRRRSNRFHTPASAIRSIRACMRVTAMVWTILKAVLASPVAPSPTITAASSETSARGSTSCMRKPLATGIASPSRPVITPIASTIV